jgi:copper chaperone
MGKPRLRLSVESHEARKERTMSTKPTILSVAGMTCPSCVRHVQAALKGVDGVEAVEVRLREGEVRVLSDGGASVEAMIEALHRAGYESSAAS